MSVFSIQFFNDIFLGLYCIFTQFVTCARHIHHELVFYSSKLQNPKPKPGFEGIQTRNHGWFGNSHPSLESLVFNKLTDLLTHCLSDWSLSGSKERTTVKHQPSDCHGSA